MGRQITMFLALAPSAGTLLRVRQGTAQPAEGARCATTGTPTRTSHLPPTPYSDSADSVDPLEGAA